MLAIWLGREIEANDVLTIQLALEVDERQDVKGLLFLYCSHVVRQGRSYQSDYNVPGRKCKC